MGAAGRTGRTRRQVSWPPFALGVLLGLLLTPAGTVLGVVHDDSTALQVLGFGGPPLLGVGLCLPRRTRWAGVGLLVGFAVFWVVLIPLAALTFGG